MKKIVMIGLGLLIAGSIILGLFLVILLHSCFYFVTPFDTGGAPVPIGGGRCYALHYVYPEIIIGIAMIITGIVLRSRGHKNIMN
jgi:hypothetical protein